MQDVNKAIKIRYKLEADKEDVNLSCGSNLSYAQLQRGEIILDLGCGIGKETIAAAQLVAPEGKAIGLDITPEMLAGARQNARDAGAANVEFVLGDISSLPFENDTFSAVLSNCVINHAKNKLAVYQEIHRVLKPGGRFVISDIVAIDELPKAVREDEKAWVNCFAGAESKDFYFKTIADAGFRKVDILRWKEYKKEGFLIASVTLYAFKEKG